MRMIDADEVIKFYANFINEHGFDPKDARFSIRDIEMNLWNIPTVEPTVNKWIPCSERLPKEKGYYLVTRKNPKGYVTRVIYDPSRVERGVYNSPWRNGDSDVLAWMPLPKPYEVKENDSD